MVLHTHSQPSWMKAWIVQTIRGRKVNMSSGQGITSCHVGGNPICSLVQRFREHFRGVNYFSYLLVGCNCSRRGENVYSCGHALTAFHLCESLLNIYLCTSPTSPPPTPAISRYTEDLSSDPLLDCIHRCNPLLPYSKFSASLRLYHQHHASISVKPSESW